MNPGSSHLREDGRWNWKGDDATDSSKRERARGLYPLPDKCDECPKPATDRHHKDGNTAHNERSNIAFLCRRCHMIADGRLERFKALVPVPVQPPKPCVNCKELKKPLRKGRCDRCSSHMRKRGAEWYEGCPRIPRARLIERCANCATTDALKGASRGRCEPCSRYFKNKGRERPQEYWGKDGRKLGVKLVTPRDQIRK